ncbi:MAG: exodeoxyribonuclease VII small subunit [Clostridiaceae bacterium]|nr:exodeoxyribonuclease VII small subunit [Clostridiaceae bacterium]
MKDVSEISEPKDKNDATVDDEKSYEEKVARLEEIVSLLERGEVSLEQSMELFQEGVVLSNLCARQLSQVESTIEKLMENGATIDFSAADDIELS